jgi:hypothetical protein
MKRLMLGLMIVAVLTGLAACDQAQQALDAIDKAKAFKDDVQKKASEVTIKARELIPGTSCEDQKDRGDSQNRGDSKDRREKEDEKDN